MIPRYNDVPVIPLLPWHIVISGFHCIHENHKTRETSLDNRKVWIIEVRIIEVRL